MFDNSLNLFNAIRKYDLQRTNAEVIIPKINGQKDNFEDLFERFTEREMINHFKEFGHLHGLWRENAMKYQKKFARLNGEQYSVLDGAFENAFLWGNRKKPFLPVLVFQYDANGKILIRIEDSGWGFNYRKKIREFESRKKYYKGAGMGFERFAFTQGVRVYWEGRGNIINLLFDV